MLEDAESHTLPKDILERKFQTWCSASKEWRGGRDFKRAGVKHGSKLKIVFCLADVECSVESTLYLVTYIGGGNKKNHQPVVKHEYIPTVTLVIHKSEVNNVSFHFL